jgi:hypothetical protein
MSYTGSLFANEGGHPLNQIPRSCIESAEYIIQCLAAGGLLGWAEGQERTPHVIACFGNNVTFNITTQENFHTDPRCNGLVDYAFNGQLPAIGQGLILLNKTGADQPFNMHLGAVIATARNRVKISDVSENGPVAMIANWETKVLNTIEDFRGDDYPANNFAIGLLTV